VIALSRGIAGSSSDASDGESPDHALIEVTLDPTTWLVITGWDSTSRERAYDP
jgi:hypothetical protein